VTDAGVRITRLSLFGFLVVLVLTWFCYQPAMSGPFQLDDVSNLAGLANVEDAASMLEFALSGEAGPSGRPLALLTFALQAAHWDEGASAFLHVNLLIHLLNALVLAWFLYQLGLLRGVERHKAVVTATAAAGIWVIMPLLATATLLVVQRMATLSALFVLLGLAGYLLARRRIGAAPTGALLGMSASIVAGVLLSILCKESGLLLPTLILALESTLLRRPGSVTRARWRLWQAVFLWLPTLVVVAYLASRAVYPDWMIGKRDFNAWERVLTEARVLWIYLLKAIIGLPSQLGVYQDPPAISRSLLEFPALLASIAWLAVTTAALVWRRRFPLFAFAVLWYLTGHLLESTVFPLEPYFEYRNYLPMVGPAYALCSYMLLGGAPLRRAAAMALPVYVIGSAYFLYSFSSLSGEPSPASRYWATQYPNSVRAVTTMATYQLAEEGPLRTLATIDRFAIAQPQHAYLRIQELNLLCRVVPGQDHSAVLLELRRDLPGVDFTYSAGTMLSQLLDTIAAGDCKDVDLGTVRELAEVLQANPRYVLNPSYNQFHHKLLAGIARLQGDFAESIALLEKAIAYKPSTELNMMMVTALAAAGDYAAANAFIESASEQSPRNPMRALAWRRGLEKLRAYVGELERYSQSPE
jgi:tetratricopeptide (TPR) repeat protein